MAAVRSGRAPRRRRRAPCTREQRGRDQAASLERRVITSATGCGNAHVFGVRVPLGRLVPHLFQPPDEERLEVHGGGGGASWVRCGAVRCGGGAVRMSADWSTVNGRVQIRMLRFGLAVQCQNNLLFSESQRKVPAPDKAATPCQACARRRGGASVPNFVVLLFFLVIHQCPLKQRASSTCHTPTALHTVAGSSSPPRAIAKHAGADKLQKRTPIGLVLATAVVQR